MIKMEYLNIEINSEDDKGLTNWSHGNKHARKGANKEVFTCTKLRAHKSMKTPLSSTPMLSKVVSYFCDSAP